jgi:hypothetical protein
MIGSFLTVTESSAQVYLSDALNIGSLFTPKSTTFVAKIQHSVLLLKNNTKIPQK